MFISTVDSFRDSVHICSQRFLFYCLQLQETLLQLPDIDARVSAVVDLITQHYKEISRDVLSFSASSFYWKLKAAEKYVPHCKYHGNVTLMKAKSHNEIEEELGGDYNLSEVSLRSISHCKVFCLEYNQYSCLWVFTLCRYFTLLKKFLLG